MKVVKFKSFADEAKEDVIKDIEDLLADAKAGRIEGFAYAAARTDCSVSTNWTKSPNVHLLVSGLSILQHRLIESLDHDD